MALFGKHHCWLTVTIAAFALIGCDDADMPSLSDSSGPNVVADGDLDVNAGGGDTGKAEKPSCSVALVTDPNEPERPAAGDPANLAVAAKHLPTGAILRFGPAEELAELETENDSSEYNARHRVIYPEVSQLYKGIISLENKELATCSFELGKDDVTEQPPEPTPEAPTPTPEAPTPISCTVSASQTAVTSSSDQFNITLTITGTPSQVLLDGNDVTSSFANFSTYTLSNQSISATKDYSATVRAPGQADATCTKRVSFTPGAPTCTVSFQNLQMQTIQSIRSPATYYAVINHSGGGDVTGLARVTTNGDVQATVSPTGVSKVSLSASASTSSTISHTFRVSGPGGNNTCNGSLTLSNPVAPTCQLRVVQNNIEKTAVTVEQPTNLVAMMRFGNSDHAPTAKSFTWNNTKYTASNNNPASAIISFGKTATLSGSFYYLGVEKPCNNTVSIEYEPPPLVAPSCSVYFVQNGVERTSVALTSPQTLRARMRFGSYTQAPTTMRFQWNNGGDIFTSGINPAEADISVSQSGALTGSFYFNGTKHSCGNGGVQVTYTPPAPTCSLGIVQNGIEKASVDLTTAGTLTTRMWFSSSAGVSGVRFNFNNNQAVGSSPNPSTAQMYFDRAGELTGSFIYNGSTVPCSGSVPVNFAPDTGSLTCYVEGWNAGMWHRTLNYSYQSSFAFRAVVQPMGGISDIKLRADNGTTWVNNYDSINVRNANAVYARFIFNGNLYNNVCQPAIIRQVLP